MKDECAFRDGWMYASKTMEGWVRRLHSARCLHHLFCTLAGGWWVPSPSIGWLGLPNNAALRRAIVNCKLNRHVPYPKFPISAKPKRSCGLARGASGLRIWPAPHPMARWKNEGIARWRVGLNANRRATHNRSSSAHQIGGNRLLKQTFETDFGISPWHIGWQRR